MLILYHVFKAWVGGGGGGVGWQEGGSGVAKGGRGTISDILRLQKHKEN